ncbi:hypothetical protein FRC02_009701 [Tulasnella sp. 418]|nr:hypothetical protein FRC02_009701 [Tulasnella sp. 418]
MVHPLPPRPNPHATQLIVNPYAPHINYNILDINSLSAWKPPPGLNGAGTSGTLSCAHQRCLFRTDSHAILSQHKMDRHLIYPKNWKQSKRKQMSDDEQEESVDEEQIARIKGCTTVPGTTLVLDTPEAIEAWKAERKKRWPSAQRVQDKAQARQEAIARGELVPSLKGKHKKKSIVSDERLSRGSRGRGHGSFHRGGRGRGTSSGQFVTQSRHLPYTTQKPSTLPAKPSFQPPVPSKSVSGNLDDISSDDSDEDSTESSNSDMDPVKDAISSKQRPPNLPISSEDEEETSEKEKATVNQPARALLPNKRPRPPPGPRPNQRNNPYSNHPSLLRNLLLPDIHATVSHFSQAIRFIVSNDFFDNVELKPGDAEKQLIVISDTVNNPERKSPGMEVDVNPL